MQDHPSQMVRPVQESEHLFQIVLCKGAAASQFMFAQPLFDKAN